MERRLVLENGPPLGRLCLLLEPERLLDLLKFEPDEFVVDVAVAVVLDKEVERLLLAAVRHEEPGRLGNELSADQDLTRGNGIRVSASRSC